MEQNQQPQNQVPTPTPTPVDPQQEYLHHPPSVGHSIDLSKLFTPVAILVGCIIIAAVVYISRPVAVTVPTLGDTNKAQPTFSINDVSTEGEPFIGKADAPVTVAYWTDFQCPYCKHFEMNAFQDVLKDYINTGKVKMIFKDFQFLGPDSFAAAVAARSVWTLYPNQYFAWREAMFNAQDNENGGFGNEDSIVALTKKIPGIDAKKVVDDITANQAKYQALVNADIQEAQKFGVRGTPAFVIGTQMTPGALEYSEIKPLIDAELKKVK
jgi:protein-disulfide isomerase